MQIIQVNDLGSNRNKFLSKVAKVAGKGNWFWAFQANKKLYSLQWGMQLYEDAYWHFMRNNLDCLKEIVGYANVFVYNRHDIASNLNYGIQKQEADHFQDIAIRRCLVRFGIWFKGTDILEIPGTKFDHTQVEFHLPHLLNKATKNCAKSWLDKHRLIVITESDEDKFSLAELMVHE